METGSSFGYNPIMTPATLPPPSGFPPPAVEAILTAADVARLPRTLVTTDVDYELHDGRLVVMAPPGANHARRQSKFSRYLQTEGEERGLGLALAEVGILLRRNPDHLLGADAAFLTTSQLPPRLSSEGYLLSVPLLVVEIRSKSNTQMELDAKVRDYLEAGAVLVWVADPDTRTVTAHRTKELPLVFTATDTLTADPVIPGFAVAVAELLPEL
jgi:Uma2 family endonuclease